MVHRRLDDHPAADVGARAHHVNARRAPEDKFGLGGCRQSHDSACSRRPRRLTFACAAIAARRRHTDAVHRQDDIILYNRRVSYSCAHRAVIAILSGHIYCCLPLLLSYY